MKPNQCTIMYIRPMYTYAYQFMGYVQQMINVRTSVSSVVAINQRMPATDACTNTSMAAMCMHIQLPMNAGMID